jgi:hypothetical protein
MPIFRSRLAGLIGALVLTVVAGPLALAADRPVPFKSAEQALEQGLLNYRNNNFERAVSALRYAASQTGRTHIPAQYYLARIYAESGTGFTDNGQAYQLYLQIATENADTIDPDDRSQVPFVAKSLNAVAAYLRAGLPQIGLERDVVRAAQFLRYAATSFGDEDAQFELAKLYLKGEEVEDLAFARHYLSVLAQKGHPGAQAVLAEQYWRGGKIVERDAKRALALITVAVDNAPTQDRIWIEDIYHRIFCGSSQGVRNNADGIVQTWRKQSSRPLDAQQRSSLGARDLEPEAARTCSDGEQVLAGRRVAAPPVAAQPKESTHDFRQGSTFGVIDANSPAPARK